ncbi:hypothetical protein ABZZ80_29130 [Streptomyces sp. NPDC006356]
MGVLLRRPPGSIASAAAIEESAADLGNVLGIAVLGSVAAAVYQGHFTGNTTVPEAARESVTGSLAAAGSTPGLAEHIRIASTDALAVTGLVGTALMVLATVAVGLLVPRGFDTSAGHH